MSAPTKPWFASVWWTTTWGWRACGIFCLALTAEGIWGAVKFGGGWAYAYGSCALAGLLVGAAFLSTARRHRQ